MRARRRLLRLLAGFAAALALAAVVCFDRIDYQPYFTTPYYRETVARLEATAATNELAHGELAAGFGRARLTPALGVTEDQPAEGRFRAVPLAGYGSRKGRPATGIHDELHVKAVALRVATQLVVVASADALIIPREVADLASQELGRDPGLRREHLYFGATHTHSSLGGWGEGPVAEVFAGPFQPGVRTWFANQIVRAVRDAIADLQPASLGVGRCAAPAFVRNRLLGDAGRVNPDFSFAVFRQNNGDLCVLGSFSAHATVLPSDTFEFSADYPGAWQAAVEQATGGTAIFLAGAVGSHSPVAGEGTFAGAERMGRALANLVWDEASKLALTNVVTLGILGIPVRLPPLHVRVSDSIRLRPWLATRLLRAHPEAALQVLRLGDSLWISTPCDYSGELALEWSERLSGRGWSVTVTSFNGDYVGYVIPSRYYHLGGYEPRVMSFFGPNVPDYFDDLIRRMVADLTSR